MPMGRCSFRVCLDAGSVQPSALRFLSLAVVVVVCVCVCWWSFLAVLSSRNNASRAALCAGAVHGLTPLLHQAQPHTADTLARKRSCVSA